LIFTLFFGQVLNWTMLYPNCICWGSFTNYVTLFGKGESSLKNLWQFKHKKFFSIENLWQGGKGGQEKSFFCVTYLATNPLRKKVGPTSKATLNSNKKTLEIIHALFEGVSSLTASRWCKTMLCVTLQTSITTLTCT